MHYTLKHMTSQASTGYFAAMPDPEITIEQCLEHLLRHPLDLFMHRYLLEKLSELKTDELNRIKDQFDHPVVNCLLAEIREDSNLLSELVSGDEQLTPLGELDTCKTDNPETQYWIKAFEANVHRLEPLPAFDLDFPYQPGSMPGRMISVGDIPLPPGIKAPSSPPLSREVAEIAAFRLQNLGILSGQEMRHENSFAPVGLTRKWFLQREINTKELSYGLSGIQTAYGRGTDIGSARAGLLMEIVERFCSFASVRENRISRLMTDASELIKAEHAQIADQGANCIHPDHVLPDYPYRGEKLVWMSAREETSSGPRKILIPAQLVFLFCNLHEKTLFAAPSSTGLAAGASLEQAEHNALLEVLERDALALGLFSPESCFRLRAKSGPLAHILNELKEKNIDVIFQDITPDFGLPVYKAFIRDQNGGLYFGSGAHLNAMQAALSALTEIPVPDGTRPRTEALSLPLRELDALALPDFSQNNPAADLSILKNMLLKNGYRPIFAEITRRDLGFPVVRAIVPGLEPAVDFDRYRRITSRLRQTFLKKSNRRFRT
ncbi:MAG: YcaO-like family protein [Thermodesulfobacteriota bacterium]